MLFINLTRLLFSFKYLHSFNKCLIGSSKGIIKIFGNASWFLFFYWVNFKVKRIMKKWFLKSLKDFIMEIFQTENLKEFHSDYQYIHHSYFSKHFLLRIYPSIYPSVHPTIRLNLFMMHLKINCRHFPLSTSACILLFFIFFSWDKI